MDGYFLDRAVSAVREEGDCARASAVASRITLAHRIAAAPAAARGLETELVCKRLIAAKTQLAAALAGGGQDAARAGYDGLQKVASEQPGHDRMVNAVLDAFLRGLPTADPCTTAAITDAMRGRPMLTETDRSSAVVARIALAALVGCGDRQLAAKHWDQALFRFQEVVDHYPGTPVLAHAKDGVRHATLEVELANVRSLLEPLRRARLLRFAGAVQRSSAVRPGSEPGLLRQQRLWSRRQ
jgi:hypothetical protein